jgi:hypothetical protein
MHFSPSLLPAIQELFIRARTCGSDQTCNYYSPIGRFASAAPHELDEQARRGELLPAEIAPRNNLPVKNVADGRGHNLLRISLTIRGSGSWISGAAASVSHQVSLLLRNRTLEMTVDLFTAQRVSGIGQYDRTDDCFTRNLRGDKCADFRQFLVNEFHFSAFFKFLDPLFLLQFPISSAEINVGRGSTLFGTRNRGWEMKSHILGNWYSNDEHQWRTAL